MAIGLLSDGKWVFNKAGTMPWFHAVVHFEVNMSRFCALCEGDRPHDGRTSPKQAALPPGRFPMR